MQAAPIRVSFALFLCTGPVLGQTTHIVDATGQNGRFKTVVAAVQAANRGDKILIYPGIYPGTIELVGKPLSLIGITGKAYDVVLRSTFASGNGLLVRSHPAGGVSRFASLTLDQVTGFGGVAVIGAGYGDIYFENVWSGRPWYVANWQGTVSMANCLAKVADPLSTNLPYAVMFSAVQHVFLRDCVFEANFGSPIGLGADCVAFESCAAEIVQCSFAGPFAENNGSRSGNGGIGARFFSTRARISGDGSDLITGGISQIFASTRGGFGVVLQSSVLQWSGTRIIGGVAIGQGQPGQPFLVDALSKLVNIQPAFPLIRPRDVAIGKLGRIDLHAWPNALSLTLASPTLAPTLTPFGVLSIDLTQPAFQVFASHDASGAASIPVDLRPLPPTFIGVHFGLQTLAASATMGPLMSAPWVKVLH